MIVTRADLDGERLEAMATTGRAPVRITAAALLRLDAHLGAWRRRSQPVEWPAGQTPLVRLAPAPAAVAPAFPAELEELADRHLEGIADDDAWDRWISSGVGDEAAVVDGPVGLPERLEERVHSAGAALGGVWRRQQRPAPV